MDKWVQNKHVSRLEQTAGLGKQRLVSWWGGQSQATDQRMLETPCFCCVRRWAAMVLFCPALWLPTLPSTSLYWTVTLAGWEVYQLCLCTSCRWAQCQVTGWESFHEEWTARPWVGRIYWSRPSLSTSLVFVIKAAKQAESNDVDI